MKALIISADNFEDSELLIPYYRLREAGVEVTVASMRSGTIKGKHGYDVKVDQTLDAVDPEGYALLVLPGGKAPEKVRKEVKAIEIAQSFFKRHKPVAAICHGPQTLISAGLLKGRHATCYRSVAEELKGAGALYEDREVVVDGNLVTSREPSDLPAFMRETMKQIKLQITDGSADGGLIRLPNGQTNAVRTTPRPVQLSLAANNDPELITALAAYPVDEVYGKLPADGVSGGRPRYLATPLSEADVGRYIGLLDRNGIAFNYLLNGACFGNREWTRSWQKRVTALLRQPVRRGPP